MRRGGKNDIILSKQSGVAGEVPVFWLTGTTLIRCFGKFSNPPSGSTWLENALVDRVRWHAERKGRFPARPFSGIEPTTRRIKQRHIDEQVEGEGDAERGS